MGHTKATPDNERPTLDELLIRERFTGPRPKAVKIFGYWEQQSDGCRPEFEVTISGDDCDVDEVVESLKENGNLHDLKIEKVV